MWRTGAEEEQRFFYIRTGEVDWVFNSELTPDSEVHWALAQEPPPVEETGPVVLGEGMLWEVFDGKELVHMALAVASE